ncbi:hypothetical protein AAE02nite_15570 [Adhaeribacter aerolatus]|uniref:YdhG-like domain-containing protein n=1 Tax=Adhaeribacter aerolatus TaxID=670289 RepID=A0A512AVZ8_9BACT|nr:DUF1801 domain-containing protein [Adhaeribacter aerolatus]GEO03893.1 hypothetical protein AAE02nite_15570 [Adhaeribacter aerolatus]
MTAVDLFIAEQTEANQSILLRLQNIILSSAPQLEEKISYRVPFYFYFGRLCYLNPLRQGVAIGFCRGFELSDEQGLMEAKDRKEIKTITYKNIAAIDERVLREVLQEALVLNEWHYRNKKK